MTDTSADAPRTQDTSEAAQDGGERHRALIDMLYTLLHQSWVAPEHTDRAVERLDAGESLADVFSEYTDSSAHQTRQWMLRNDPRKLDREGLAALFGAVLGRDVEAAHLDYVEAQLASGRKLESLLHETLESPEAVARLAGKADAPIKPAATRRLLSDFYKLALDQTLGKDDLDHLEWTIAHEGGLGKLLAKVARRKRFRQRRAAMDELFVDPGHFYSPVVDTKTLDVDALATPDREKVHGVDIDAVAMRELWSSLLPHMKAMDFPEDAETSRRRGLRYHTANPAYGWGDAVVYHALLRKLKPKRIVEVGSGFSSALALDTLDAHFETSPSVDFVDPYPKLLRSMLTPADESRVTVHESGVQDVDLDLFRKLRKDDILFIDSTHIVKTHSDVHWELTEILPVLRKGVVVHIHDMFWPFEYPRGWIVDDKRSWNELYAIHYFLMFQKTFEVMFFNHYFAHQHIELAEETLPVFAGAPGGGLWLRKVT